MLFRRTDLPLEERIADLISRMTLEEKVSQMIYDSAAIPHLGIEEYNWWNECLHGVARAGVATVFPQAIGMAASFNAPLLQKVAEVTATEARAKHHEAARRGDRGIYKGLTFWTPNVNIFRDPRWGRGQETYGEDPHLTAELGIAFVRGLQGDDPKYLKTAACAKHYAVHSGPESLRHSFDARCSQKDLYETYLPAFRALVVDADVESVMGAYNRTNGEPCCASPTLLQKILREDWGFEGHVVSDCGAIYDIHAHHKVTNSPEESAALAVKNGCDLNCGRVYPALREAVAQGLISEEEIDQALARLLRTKFKLGLFDPEEEVPFANVPYEVVACPEHRSLAREMARQSMVLLKNENNLLPLGTDLKTVAVIGPNADARKVLLGNYFGTSTQLVTALDGIRRKLEPDCKVLFAEGCDLTTTKPGYWGDSPKSGFAEALAVAERADAVIMCMGISPDLEGEEGAAANSDGGGDRIGLDLPGMQEELIKEVAALGKPLVLVLFSGSPLTVNWAHEHVPAIIQAWYPGEEGGNALADIIFGDYNPAGRLPITFVKSVDQLPPFTDYAMAGRTYRFSEEKPLYPFGYGLSYTTFAYSNLQAPPELAIGQDLVVQVDVENTGQRTGDEVVQLYIKHLSASVPTPRHSLQGFARIPLEPGEKRTVTFRLSPRQLAVFDEDGRCLVEPGVVEIFVGGSQPDPRSQELTGEKPLSIRVKLEGSTVELPR
ncbi:MAG: glycoside hydrolase family 3 C-terminal domain-containing protein [Limnochordia bacterium]|jgi:beta-glucosidase|nr:glycoside hydrolase family 3 C-terminal domain-containing protein [Bacillota bacterium]